MHSLECSVSRTPIKKRNKVEKLPDKIILFINFGFNSENRRHRLQIIHSNSKKEGKSS